MLRGWARHRRLWGQRRQRSRPVLLVVDELWGALRGHVEDLLGLERLRTLRAGSTGYRFGFHGHIGCMWLCRSTIVRLLEGGPACEQISEGRMPGTCERR